MGTKRGGSQEQQKAKILVKHGYDDVELWTLFSKISKRLQESDSAVVSADSLLPFIMEELTEGQRGILMMFGVSALISHCYKRAAEASKQGGIQ